MASRDMWLNPGMLIPISIADLKADDSSPKYAKGQISFIRDAFGDRIFKYLRCRQSGGHAKGELAAKAANVAVNNITDGTTTSVTTSGLTADLFVDRLLYCLDNADSAGAAPEGEVGIIVANSTTLITIDSAIPFSVAAALNDDFVVVSIFDVVDAAATDLAQNIMGVCVNGISVDNWGWYQVKGIVPQALIVDAEGLTAGQDLGPGAARISTSVSGLEDVIGHALVTVTSDTVNDYAPVYINVYHTAFSGTTP